MAKQRHLGHSGDSTLNSTHVVSSVGRENKAQFFASCAVLLPPFSPFFGPRTALCSHGHLNYSSGSTLLHLSAHHCRLKPVTALRHSASSWLKVFPGSGWLWVMCQIAATPGWCSQEGWEVPGWCYWKELSSTVVVQGLGKQSGAGVEWEKQCFPGWIPLVLRQPRQWCATQLPRWRKLEAETPLGQLDGWEASGLAMFRSMDTLILRWTMVSWCTEGPCAGEMSSFTIPIMTYVVDVAASKPNPKPTRNWRRKTVPGTVWADFRRGECKPLVGHSKM